MRIDELLLNTLANATLADESLFPTEYLEHCLEHLTKLGQEKALVRYTAGRVRGELELRRRKGKDSDFNGS